MYRVVRSRGKSLQEGANQLQGHCHDTQLSPLANSCRLTPNAWVGHPRKCQGEGYSGFCLTSAQNRNSAFPGRGGCRVSGSQTGSWPYKNPVSKVVF